MSSGGSGIIRLKHIKVFSICVHPLMVPTSDAHTTTTTSTTVTSCTRIMNEGNVCCLCEQKHERRREAADPK